MKSYEFAIEAQKLKRSWAFRCRCPRMACKTHAYNILKRVRQVSTKPLHNSLHFCVGSKHDIDWFYCSTAPPPQPRVQATCAKVKCHSAKVKISRASWSWSLIEWQGLPALSYEVGNAILISHSIGLQCKF